MGWKGYTNALGIPLNSAPEPTSSNPAGWTSILGLTGINISGAGQPTSSGNPAGWTSILGLTGITISGTGQPTSSGNPAGWKTLPGLVHVFGPSGASKRGPLGWKSYLTLIGVILTHSVRPKVIHSLPCSKNYYLVKNKVAIFDPSRGIPTYWQVTEGKNLYSKKTGSFPVKQPDVFFKKKEEHPFPKNEGGKFPKKDKPEGGFFSPRRCL